MTKALLLDLVGHQKVLELVLLFLAAFFNIGITYWLGTKFLKIKIPHYQIFFGVLCQTIINLAMRFFVPIKITPLIFIILMSLSFSILGKTSYVKAFGYSSLLVVFNAVGDVLTVGIAIAYQPIGNFITGSAYGVALFSLTESIVPALALVIKKEPILPAEWSSREVLVNALQYFLGVFLIMICLVNFYNNKMQLNDFLILVLILAFIYILFFINTNNLKKRHDNEKTMWQKQLEEVKKKGHEQKISPADMDRLKYFWTMFDYEASQIFGKK
jgi:hypothetical protein